MSEDMKLINNWEELAKVEESETHRLQIDKIGSELCTGWIIPKEDGTREEYLSTHTFYGHKVKYSNKRLQECGFNIELKSWD